MCKNGGVITFLINKFLTLFIKYELRNYKNKYLPKLGRFIDYSTVVDTVISATILPSLASNVTLSPSFTFPSSINSAR